MHKMLARKLLERQMRNYMQHAHWDDAPIHRFVELRAHDGQPRGIGDLEMMLHEFPNTFMAELPHINRMPAKEKAALKREIIEKFAVDVAEPDTFEMRCAAVAERARWLAIVDALPETPTLGEAPLFSLPAWE